MQRGMNYFPYTEMLILDPQDSKCAHSSDPESATKLRLSLQAFKLPHHSRLSVDLFHLRIFELFTASKSHFQVLDGTDLLLQAANLLGVGILTGLGLGRCGRGRSSRSCTTLLLGRIVVLIARIESLTMLGVATAAATVVSGSASGISAVAVSRTAPFRASARARGSVIVRSQASTPIGLDFGSAVLVVLFATLLLVLFRTIIANRFSTGYTPTGRLRGLGRLGTRDSATRTAEAIGSDILRSVAHKMSSATLIFSLEMKWCGKASSTGRSVGTSRFAGRLNRAQIGSSRRVRCGHRIQRIPSGYIFRSRGAPNDIVQLDHIFVIHDGTTNMPELHTIVDTEPRGCCGRHDVATVWAPLANTGVATFNSADLAVVLFKVIHVDLTSQVAKAGNKDKASAGGKGDGVSRAKGE